MVNSSGFRPANTPYRCWPRWNPRFVIRNVAPLSDPDIEHHRGIRSPLQAVRQMTHTDQRQRPPKTSACAAGSILTHRLRPTLASPECTFVQWKPSKSR